MSRAEDMAGQRDGARRSSIARIPATLAGVLLTCCSYQALMIATARADDPCSSAGGVTTCSGNQVDGAANIGSDATLVVTGLTNPAIAPAGGVPGVTTVFAPGHADDGSDSFAGIPNGDADNGSATPNVSITTTSPGAGFAITSSSYGIVGQSRGQAGGAGGHGFGTTIPLPPFVLPALGGDGGSGGAGGSVTIVTQGPGQITTSGDNNHGIMGLSSGGAGGNGGDADALLGIYGNGGEGGAGGAPSFVSITNTFDITTSGTGATGIWAQSVGGSGGSGGTAEGSAINDGGDGAAASNGGTVDVTSSGRINTGGDNAVGVFAQSVGGFAGSGGGSFGIGLSFGGSSSSAGSGGNVTVNITGGSITTTGQSAAGIVAQSVGGGGGYGGAGGGLVGFGGDATSGGTGGIVDVTNRAEISTNGNTSSGIYAQSVGGSGGNGAPSGGLFSLGGSGGGGGDGNAVTVRNFGTITVRGSDSYGIFAQSVGGGGGDGGASGGLVSIGGSGTTGGNGGAVLVENSGSITAGCVTCTGTGAIFAQSVGGGGGNGGVSGGLVSIGGSGAGGANGQSVTVRSFGATLSTQGSESDGVFAQSIGGGGGRGGISGGLVAIGGSGGGGGIGGAVEVATSGLITTGGDNAAGIYAQSVGGGGGRGGVTGGLVSVGGSGGGGGAAGTVTVNNSAEIRTSGAGSEAIFAQSIGGGGGDGGFAGGWFSFGGGGADDQAGGAGGLVTVTNAGNLSTTGANAAALFAQSVGGGGGSGGGSVGIGAFASLAIGGSGGKGGNGGDVKVNEFTNAATPGYTITTQQDNSAGVFAQSIGGGGGAGGFALAASGGLYGSVSAAFGGSGGGGGQAGTVIVGNSGIIETHGNFSSGISAQSVGGGGGSGGFAISAAVSTGAAAALSFGGSGEKGGDGGDVTVNSFTGITTTGMQSHGIFAHSIGGGGGDGGFAVSAAGSPYGSLALGFGGDGEGGGNGGVVKVNSTGAIQTSGAMSHGILAESIGGGGGSGGFSVGAAATVSGNSVSAALSFGGKGGGGGDGRLVEVHNAGNITVTGDGSVGILAQSVGGGGGNGGFSGAISISAGNTYGNSVGGSGGTASMGGEVIVESQGHIVTGSETVVGGVTVRTGANGVGILAQSIGGGGGNGGFSLAGTVSLQGDSTGQSVGGAGGAGGAASDVTVHHVGSIDTYGDLAAGILAQSVRGGGGNGGFSAGVAVSLQGNAKMSSVGGQGGSAAPDDAANPDTAENDTVVHVTAEGGIIETRGAMSHGIQAQSIGGGGGNGGFAVGGSFSLKADSSSDVGGGTGGSGGNAGKVIVDSSDQIITHGNNAIGIFAQSVGGGGGSGGFSLSAGLSGQGGGVSNSVGGAGGVAGNGGDVEVNVLAGGSIHTYGALAHGIQAQSIGGGGGNGGFAIGVGASLDGDAESKVGGGAGGAGGTSGTVTVTNKGTIETEGAGAIGIFAQSVGGGGGSGGFAISGTLGSAAVSNSVGGAGGAGSDGGVVEVTNDGLIHTRGANSIGILAQSVGGGGGNGAFSIAAGVSTSSGGSASSVGGGGAAGGDGKSVTVTNTGTIIADGNLSTGILAQSIGGGGGNGGISVAGSLASGGNTASSVGGTGGLGGSGGDVTVTNTGTIAVNGSNSFGIFAQSVGGGGGSGGFSGGLAVGGTVENTVGGSGGKGGNGGDVTVISTGQIYTAQDNSSAVFAQSVAGSGGWGGLAIGLGTGGGSTGLTIGLGANGDTLDPDAITGGDGQKGKVTVTISGDNATQTDGALSYGLLAQSVGGGGGAAGSVLRGLLDFIGSDVDVRVGSNGSMNGNGLFQSSTYSNATLTNGLGSIGLISQSIGGGGGVSGLVLESVSLNPLGNDSFHIDVGGFSGGAGLTGGGSGGGFELTAQGPVTTTNANAIGVLAQTIGGGGGVGNVTVGTVINTGNTLAVTVGGSQLTKGDAGAASTVTAQQKITTSGVLSHGLVAQSIGGGGGMADIVFQNGVTFSNGVAVTLGSGAGGAGGDGGAVRAEAAAVQTSGNGAFGIVAQSIGGGGGLTGIASGASVLGQPGFALSPVTISGGTGAGGNGAAVTVVANGAVHTSGFGAHGIVAQSIGGGGGIAGAGLFATTLGGSGAFAGSVGNAGTAGAVDVSTFSNVVVTGQQAVGIFAQSAGGSGNSNVAVHVSNAGNGIGLVWAPDGSGAAVQIADGAANTLDTNGTLYAQGGLYGSGAPPRLDGLAVLGGKGDEAVTNLAYAFPGTPDPSTGYGYGTDYGVVFNLSSGATDPDTGDLIFDVGTRTSNVIGNVDLGAGNNSFTNQQGALFITSEFVRLDSTGNPVPLGGGQQLTNDGLLSPGDRNRVQVTEVAGNFVQTAAGTYFVDVDLNQQNTGNEVTDKLNVTGGAEVGGKGGLLLLSINKSFEEYVIVHAEQGVADTGFDPVIEPAGVGFDFNTKVENGGQDLVLYADKPSFQSLLIGSGVYDPNVFRMAGGIDNIEAAIGVDNSFNYLINLLRLEPDKAALGRALETLTPSQAPHLFELTFRRSLGFLDQVTDCPLDMGQGWFGENSCLWVAGNYGEYERQSVDDSPINKDYWSSLTIGGKFSLDPKWQIGFGIDLGQANSTQTRDNVYLSSLEGNLYQFGLGASYRETNGLGIGLLVSGSHGDWDAARRVNVDSYTQTYTSFDGIMGDGAGNEAPAFSQKQIVFDGISGTARSNPDVNGAAARLRFSYLTTLGDVRVLPFFDIDGYWMRTDARSEYGVGLANLYYPSVTQTAFTFTPGVQLDGVSQLTPSLALRAFLRGGIMFAPDDDWEAQTQFLAAPPGLAPIKIIDPYDQVLAKVDSGVMLYTATGQQLQLNYGVGLGDTTFQFNVRGALTQRF